MMNPSCFVAGRREKNYVFCKNELNIDILNDKSFQGSPLRNTQKMLSTMSRRDKINLMIELCFL